MSDEKITFPRISSDILRGSPNPPNPSALPPFAAVPKKKEGIFRPMLAADGTIERFESLLRKERLYASPKIDGIRCVMFNGAPFSRTLKPIRNITISTVLKQKALEGFDGELVVGKPYGLGVYARTNSGVMSYGGEPEFTYYVFDLHNVDVPYQHRLELLTKLLASSPDTSPIQLLPQTEISSMQQLQEIEEQYVDMGYEGVIFRRQYSPYKRNRSTLNEGFMLKLKRFIDAEGLIVGFIERQHNENEAVLDARGFTTRSSSKLGKIGSNTLGALQVQDLDNKAWLLKVGTGFDDALRGEIWRNRDKYLNKIIKYRYFPVGVKDLPRHPSYVGFRHPDDL